MNKQNRENYQAAWNTYYIKIKRYCAYFLRNDSPTVEDCCQDVFFAYWNALEKGQSIQNVQAWLYKVAYHHIKKIQKQRCEQPKLEPLENSATHARAMDIDFIEEMLKTHFTDEELLQMVKATLTDEELYLFEGCFLERKSGAEMAEKLGIRPNYLYKKKWVLKQKLTKEIHKVLSRAVDQLLKK